MLGSGTGNGAGEEFKFLRDCRRNGLNIYYESTEIASVDENSESKWFGGYTVEYFYKFGARNRYILGFLLAVLYALYWVVSHKKMYKNKMAEIAVFKMMLKGIMDNPISKE